MTKEEKQLLLNDLCGRLPYEVNGLITVHRTMSENSTINCVIDGKLYDRFANLQDSWYDNILSIKPYLRPMSSMTESEKMEVNKLGVCDDGSFHNDIYDIGISMEEAFTAISWFLERHFDINYLIEKGLALEAPEDMYKEN